jgi:hypothetical protein
MRMRLAGASCASAGGGGACSSSRSRRWPCTSRPISRGGEHAHHATAGQPTRAEQMPTGCRQIRCQQDVEQRQEGGTQQEKSTPRNQSRLFAPRSRPGPRSRLLQQRGSVSMHRGQGVEGGADRGAVPRSWPRRTCRRSAWPGCGKCTPVNGSPGEERSGEGSGGERDGASVKRGNAPGFEMQTEEDGTARWGRTGEEHVGKVRGRTSAARPTTEQRIRCFLQAAMEARMSPGSHVLRAEYTSSTCSRHGGEREQGQGGEPTGEEPATAGRGEQEASRRHARPQQSRLPGG